MYDDIVDSGAALAAVAALAAAAGATLAAAGATLAGELFITSVFYTYLSI
jgi:adenine/guanine phosphoribosyltransferase-like PRPP-binding protein